MESSVNSQCSICLNTTALSRPTLGRKTRNSKQTATNIWEAAWTKNCAESVCKLLDLELDTFKEFFVSHQQCSSCKQLLRDVDFIMRSLDTLNNRLLCLRTKVAGLLHENIRIWTQEKQITKTDPDNVPNSDQTTAACSFLIQLDTDIDCTGPEAEDSKSLLFPEPETRQQSFEMLTQSPPLEEVSECSDELSFREGSIRDDEVLDEVHQSKESDEPENEAPIDDHSTIGSSHIPVPERNYDLRSRLRSRERLTPIVYREESEDDENSNIERQSGSETGSSSMNRKSKNTPVSLLRRKRGFRPPLSTKRKDRETDSDSKFQEPHRRQLYCPVEGCRARSLSQLNLDRHYSKVHGQEPFRYKCIHPDCGKAFKHNSSFSTHMAVIHGIIIGNGTLFKCLFCSLKYLNQSKINRHMRVTHYGNDAPKFYCKVCNLLFFVEEHCMDHEKLHTDDTGYDCVFKRCRTRRLTSQEALVDHVKRLHHGGGIFPQKFNCPTCGKRFTQENLDYHMTKHQNPRLGQSQSDTKKSARKKRKVCATISDKSSTAAGYPVQTERTEDEQLENTIEFLLQLEREEAEKNYTYVCPNTCCGRRFMDYRRLSVHHLREHGEPLFPYQFECPFCERSFLHDYLLDAHIIRRHQKAKHGFICPVVDCPLTFAQHNRFLTHISCRHPERLPEFSNTTKPVLSHWPQYRDKSLIVGSSEALSLLRKRCQTEESRRQIYCPVEGCPARSGSQVNLDIHYNKVHVQDPFPYKCTQLDCGKKFALSHGLARHTAVVHGITGKGTLFKCLFCSWKTLGQSSIDRHMRMTHYKADVPKFYCKMCNLLFFVESHRDVHEKLHTDDTGYDCVFQSCHKGLSSHEALVEHVKRVHDGVGYFPQKCICPTCGKAFASHKGLKAHMVRHNADLPFKCSYCDSCFASIPNRKSHEEAVHGDKMAKKTYNCKLCNATFTVLQYLYKHTWLIHKNNGLNAKLQVKSRKRKVSSPRNGQEKRNKKQNKTKNVQKTTQDAPEPEGQLRITRRSARINHR